MGAEVKNIGEGRLEKRLALFRDMGNYQLHAGIQGDEVTPGRNDGPTLVEIATALEYGIPGKIPERPWIRTAYDKNKKRWLKAFIRASTPAFKGDREGFENNLRVVGGIIVGDIQRSLREGDWKPNAEYTKLQKWLRAGKPGPLSSFVSQPLVDTGQLVQSHRAVMIYKGRRTLVA